MKNAEPADAIVGAAQSVTTEKSTAHLNVEEHASTPQHSSTTNFPKPSGQSLSYWLQQVRNDPLLDHRTTPELPTEVDTVIIGSGLSGTLIAHHHLHTWPEKSVIVLEARDFCSGATGRNAGHCKPDQWRGFAKYEAAFGAAQAIKILENEKETWEKLVAYVSENNVDCDLWVGETMDVPVADEVAALANQVFERYRAAGGNVGNVSVTLNEAEARRISRIRGAKACYRWQASTLQPWKLAAHVMRDNIRQGANLQTHTLATSVVESPDGNRKWIVKTNRGDIECDVVVHATNAYAAALDPLLQGLITPKPHICNHVIPPRGLSGSKALGNSYGVLLPDGGLISINTRANSDGNIMFGGSNPGQKELDDYVKEHPDRATDDGIANVEGVTKHVRAFAEKEFEGWNAKDVGPGEGFVYSWSGIIGLSGDGVPFVGALPGKNGQWICAGHHGHGMARIFTAAPALVKLMDGKKWEDTGLPDVYQITEKRVETLNLVKERKAVAVI